MAKYKYLLFDADNTLFDFDKSEKEAFRMALEGSELGYSDEVYTRYHVINDGLWKLLEVGGTDRQTLKTERYRLLFEEFGIEGDGYLETASNYERCLGLQAFEIDGVYEMLCRLSEKYEIYLVTNGLTSVQESRLSRSRLSHFFKRVYISEKVGVAKPDPAFFDYVISDIGDPDRSGYLVIGDSPSSDIDGAINSGIDCCWYDRRGVGDCGRITTYTVTNITDTEAVLQ